MNLLVIVVILVVVIALALAALKAKSAPQEATVKPEVYCLRKSLFSPAERSFLGVLEALDYEGVTLAGKSGSRTSLESKRALSVVIGSVH